MSAPIIQEAQAKPTPVASVKPITKNIDDKIEIINGRIHFKSGAKKFLSSKKVQKYLKQIASEWKKNKSKKISVIGHTDNLGKKKDNYRLGLYRSQSIKKALIAFGVKEDAILTKSMGESKPMSSNRTRKGRFFNRRVEINLR